MGSGLLYLYQKEERKVRNMKATEWIIVTVGPTGIKTAGGYIYTCYDAICSMQETLEFQNSRNAFLISTVEEWEKEKEMYGWR